MLATVKIGIDTKHTFTKMLWTLAQGKGNSNQRFLNESRFHFNLCKVLGVMDGDKILDDGDVSEECVTIVSHLGGSVHCLLCYQFNINKIS